VLPPVRPLASSGLSAGDVRSRFPSTSGGAPTSTLDMSPCLWGLDLEEPPAKKLPQARALRLALSLAALVQALEADTDPEAVERFPPPEPEAKPEREPSLPLPVLCLLRAYGLLDVLAVARAMCWGDKGEEAVVPFLANQVTGREKRRRAWRLWRFTRYLMCWRLQVRRVVSLLLRADNGQGLWAAQPQAARLLLGLLEPLPHDDYEEVG
jgi:hypothetical protein